MSTQASKCNYKWEEYEKKVPELLAKLAALGYVETQFSWVNDGLMSSSMSFEGIKEIAFQEELEPFNLYYLELMTKTKDRKFIIEATLSDDGMEPYWILSLKTYQQSMSAVGKYAGPFKVIEHTGFYERDIPSIPELEKSLIKGLAAM